MKRSYMLVVLFLVFQVLFVNTVYGQPQESATDDAYDFRLRSCPPSPSESEKAATDYAYDSLRKVIVYSLEKDLAGEKVIVNPAGLILLLGEIDNDNARELLLQMLEVYIGEAYTEALDYAVVRQGKKIRGGLQELLSKEVTCSFLGKDYVPKGKGLLNCPTKEERNRYIYWLLDLIDKGKKLEYVF